MAGTPAKTILTKSLQEIEDGHWKKGTWGVGKKNGKCSIEMGCAMGMVAIYGGEFNDDIPNGTWCDGRFYSNEDLPEGFRYVSPRIPGSHSSTGVKKAVNALFTALPKAFVREYYQGNNPDDLDLSTADKVGACVEYNDRDTTGKGRAATWFRNAIELLPTIK